MTLEQGAKQTSQAPLGSKVKQLYDQCNELIKSANYQHVTAVDAVAVCEQESGCTPIFEFEDPLFVANVGAACEGTKLPKQMLWEAILIKKGPNSGRMAKFRFEPAYWEWAVKQHCNSLQLMFQMSCSFGLGQQMMRWVIPAGKPDEWIPFIENFIADTEIQLRYLLGNMDKLLAANNNNLEAAYCAYNSGDPHSKDMAVLARANNVVVFRDRLRNEVAEQCSK